jgi:Kef-type K+ transport system membrane component KefB
MTEWVSLISLTLFIALLWIVSDVLKRYYIPPVVGEIIVGICLGPHVLDIVPNAKLTSGSIISVFGMMGCN